jgi:hypothetical protein
VQPPKAAQAPAAALGDEVPPPGPLVFCAPHARATLHMAAPWPSSPPKRASVAPLGWPPPGAVGASVAHELRNALAVAESALFLAQRNLDDRARLVRHLDQVGAEIRRAARRHRQRARPSRAASPVRREPSPLARPHRRPRDTRSSCRRTSRSRWRSSPPDLLVCCDPDPPRARLLEPVPERDRGAWRAAPAARS